MRPAAVTRLQCEVAQHWQLFPISMRSVLKRFVATVGQNPSRGRPCVDDNFVVALERLGGRPSTNASIRYRHGKDESHHAATPPDVVCFPDDTQQVQAIVRLCGQHRIPIIPFGTGTSLEGQIGAHYGGVSLDMSGMCAVLEVNEADMDCRVQAGVTRKTLNERLRHSGLGFMVDPGADASVGGMAACGASGTMAVRYGTMRETVLGLSAVLPNGELIRTGGRARKSAAGYDLTKLFVGSEGTLGVITEVQLKLHPLPAHASAAVCHFATVHSAATAVADILRLAIPVARCELLDAPTVVAFNKFARELQDLPERPTLFLEFHGASNDAVVEQAQMAGAVCQGHGASAFAFATEHAERAKLWAARHATYYAALALRPGSKGLVTDACVPISAFAELVAATADDVRQSQVVGHDLRATCSAQRTTCNGPA